MYKFIQRVMLFSFAILMLFPATGMASTIQWKEASAAVQPSKVWQVKFNHPINKDSVNSNTVYVFDADGKKLGNPVSVSSNDEKLIVVEPPNGGYENGETYTLHINQSITSKLDNKVMKQSVEMKFSIVSVDYKQLVLGTWDSSYNGYSIKATFKEDFTSDIVVLGLKNSGTYSVNGSDMTMNILGRTVTGKITKVSDNEFTVTSASGSVMRFTK